MKLVPEERAFSGEDDSARTVPTELRDASPKGCGPARPGGPLEPAVQADDGGGQGVGIGLHTPASVHYGTAAEIREQRQQTLADAYAANPGRFRGRPPQAPELPTVAWINQPTPEALIRSA